MVNVKSLFFATSLLLSGVVAAPFPARDVAAAGAEARAVDNYGAEALTFNDASLVQLEARKDKKKTKGAKTTTAAKTSAVIKTTAAPQTTAAPISSSAPKSSKASKSAGSSQVTSAKASATSASSSSSSASKSSSASSSGSACALPTKGPRSLDRRMGPLKAATNPKDIDEDLYVISKNLPADKTVTVTNLSGCTALFIWDAANNPNTFHIFCGDEAEKAERAVEMVGVNAKSYSIVASTQKNYDAAKKAIDDYTDAFEDPRLTEHKQALYTVGAGMQRLKLTTTAGSTTIKRETYTGTSKQC